MIFHLACSLHRNFVKKCIYVKSHLLLFFNRCISIKDHYKKYLLQNPYNFRFENETRSENDFRYYPLQLFIIS